MTVVLKNVLDLSSEDSCSAASRRGWGGATVRLPGKMANGGGGAAAAQRPSSRERSGDAAPRDIRAWEPVSSVALYALCSVSLNLANKAIFSKEGFQYPWLSLSIQNLVSVLLYSVIALCSRQLDLQMIISFDFQLMRELMAPTVFFTMFLVSNAYALRVISLPIMTVFKSFAPIGITMCELLVYGDALSPQLLAALLLTVASNAVTLSSDIEASVHGYVWASISVLSNIFYVFSLRYCLSERWSVSQKALWGNLLSALVMLQVSVLHSEPASFVRDFAASSASFKAMFLAAGVVGALMSFSTFWASSVTRGSTLSFTGAMTKIPVVLLGYFLFQTRISAQGWLGIGCGIVAGLMFSIVKSREAPRKARAAALAAGGGGAAANSGASVAINVSGAAGGGSPERTCGGGGSGGGAALLACELSSNVGSSIDSSDEEELYPACVGGRAEELVMEIPLHKEEVWKGR